MLEILFLVGLPTEHGSLARSLALTLALSLTHTVAPLVIIIGSHTARRIPQ